MNFVLCTKSPRQNHGIGNDVSEVSEISNTQYCNLKVYRPKNNPKWQDEFVASLKKEMPQIKLIDITKEKSRYFEFKAYDVKLEEICNFFVAKGDIPKEDVQNYLDWQGKLEKGLQMKEDEKKQ